MCGIAGIYHLDHQPPVTAHDMNRMLKPLAHRGPDDRGVFIDGSIGLGHQRLAILDLSKAGHQPMANEDKTIWLTYNGEIYNYRELMPELVAAGHRFRSQTDSEVILHAYETWGLDMFHRFNGMWALALWDAKSKRLILARDRMGIKPLYYQITPDRQLVFASEIKALLANDRHRPRPNPARLFDFLFYGFLDHTADTLFAGIEQLRPGQLMIVEGGRIRHEIYWDLPQLESSPPADLVAAFRDLLTDSVRLRLRSDVPVGSCLSGGLDSSAVVMLANQLLQQEQPASLGHRQQTFTSCFTDPRFDERRFADQVVDATGAASHQTFLMPDEMPDLVKTVTWHQDEPFGSMSILAQWKVFEAARAAGMKVMLDGQGADELLAGYHGFFGANLAELLRRQRYGALSREARLVWQRHRGSTIDALRALCMVALPPAMVRSLSRLPIVGHADLFHRQFFRRHHQTLTIPRRYPNHLTNYLAYLFREISLPALLHWEDRNSMAFSIEARVPFLDYRLVEFIFSLPDTWKIHAGTTKVILREALQEILPPGIRQRQDKMGFVTPESVWLRGPLRNEFAAFADNPSLRIWEFGRQVTYARLFRQHLGGTNHSRLLWRWYNTEVWLNRFFG